MHKILNEKPVPVEEFNDKAPAELRRLIRRCLAKSPDQRVQSIKDLALELREIVEEYDALSASASSASVVSGAAAAPPGRTSGRRPSRPGSARRRARVRPLGAAAESERGRAARGVPDHAHVDPDEPRRRHRCALSPDGRYLAYVAGRWGSPACGCARSRPAATSRCCRRARPGSSSPPSPRTATTSSTSPASPTTGSTARSSRCRRSAERRGSASSTSTRGSPSRPTASRSPSGAACPRSSRSCWSSSISQPRGSACWRLADPEIFSGRARLVPRRPDARGVPLEQPAPALGGRSSSSRPRPARGGLPRAPANSLASLAWLPDGRGLVASRRNLREPVRAGLPDHLPAAAPAGDQRLPPLFRSLGAPGATMRSPRCARPGSPTSGSPTPQAGRHGRSPRSPARRSRRQLPVAAGAGRLRRAARSDLQVWRSAREGRAARAHRRIDPLRQPLGGRWGDRLRSRGRFGSPHLAHGARRHRLAAAHPGQRRAGRALSPDGRFAAFGAGTRRGGVAAGARDRHVFVVRRGPGGIGFSPDSTRLWSAKWKKTATAWRVRSGSPYRSPAERRRRPSGSPARPSIPYGARTAGA